MTIADDIEALCCAIDTGDDTCLPILADAMEEAGDARTRGMRSVCVVHPAKQPLLLCGWWCWEKQNPRRDFLFHHLIARDFDRLPPREAVGRKGATAMAYATRSAAFLALAEALA
jgi:hypothetical protein